MYFDTVIVRLGNELLGDEGVAALKFSPKLKCLELWRNRISDAGVIALIKVLPKCFDRLNLVDNSIGDSGAIALADTLFVKLLGLGSNSIGDAGAIALAEALKARNHLRSLNLRNNVIGDMGALALAEALLNCRLEFLNLDDNSIGAAGVNALQRAIFYSSAQVLCAGVRNDVPRNLGRWELLAFVGEVAGDRSSAARRFLLKDGDRAIVWRILRCLF